MSRWSPRFAVPLVLFALFAPAAFGAVEPTHLDRLKRMQQQILLSEPAEKLEKLERRAEMRKKAKRARATKPGVKADAKAGSRGKPFMRPTDLGQPPKGAILPQATRLSGVAAPPNRRMNDHVGEPEGSCQSEVSIAAHGDNLVAAWNDGIGIYGAPFPDDTQGYAFSTDGGLNWTDGGPIPNGGQFIWSSDPVVVVNEKTGEFYFSALADAPGESGIAVIRGTFGGGTFTWDPPVIAVTFSSASNLIDKEWMAVDSLSGNLYLSYSNFALIGGSPVSNSIQFARSTNQGQNWTSPVTISAGSDAGLVQGSRPAVGPAGELYVVWHAIGQSSGSGANSPFGRDFMRIRKSVDGGQSFAAQVTADSVFSNFSSGAPGFNRGIGITFPGIAVDRSTGPNRGRVYLSWNESLNFYNDPLPPSGAVSRGEVENNNGSANATPFSPGDILRGTVSVTGNPGDHDYWKWNATQGQTTIFYLDSLAAGLDASFRVLCSDGSTLLGFSQNGFGGPDLLVFTAPSTATYFIRVASYTGTATGRYRILTTENFPQADRARDHRDLFVKSSLNGTNWGPTVRVNDSPGYFDDWLPEVQVDVKGRVFVAAYDWRDAAAICGGGSNVYLYRSDDGGANWNPGLPMTDYTTNWTLTFSTLLPNQGDYIGLYARDSTVFVAWADGRDPDPIGDIKGPDPDVYMTSTTLDCQSAPVSLVGSSVTGDTITVTWSAPQGFQANLFKRLGAGAFVDQGVVTADASDQIVFVDPDVGLGATITYRLGVTGYCEAFAGTVTVNVPGPPAAPFSLGPLRPNPTPGDVNVTFSVDPTRPATLELIDIGGRQVHKIEVNCATNPCTVNLAQGVQVKSGLYFVRLSQDGREAVKRVSIIP